MLLCISVLLLSASAAASDSAICPARIDVHEQLSASVEGWTPMLDDVPHQFAGITFYDGPPREKASLVYDRITKAAGKQTAKWQFATTKERPIWIACSYAGTAVQLTKSLPKSMTGCEVTYDARQQIAGLPVIEKMVCK